MSTRDGNLDWELMGRITDVLCFEMDEVQARVVTLRHIFGLDDLEIMNRTGLHEAAVRQLAIDGLRSLKNGVFNK